MTLHGLPDTGLYIKKNGCSQTYIAVSAKVKNIQMYPDRLRFNLSNSFLRLVPAFVFLVQRHSELTLTDEVANAQ